jgi:hypothetical protein
MKKILEYISSLEGELDDAYYSIPEYDCNSDARSSVDSARNTLYTLKELVERMDKNIIDDVWEPEYLGDR